MSLTGPFQCQAVCCAMLGLHIWIPELTLMVPKKHKDTSGQSTKLMSEARVGDDATATERMVRISDVIDPVFGYLEVRIPEKIEKIFKGVAEIKFIYLITTGNCIEIVDLKKDEALLRVFVAEFDVFDFSKPPITDINFIFNREMCKAMAREDLNKKYKESLGSNAKFSGHDHFVLQRKRYLEYQLEHGINFVFINDSSCLHAHIRSIASLLRKKDQYIPKVRKFDAKNEYLKGFLMNVPGISENMAQAIVSRHGTFESIQHGLRDKEGFCSLKVFGPAGTSHRTITDKIYRKLFNTFLSENPEEKI